MGLNNFEPQKKEVPDNMSGSSFQECLRYGHDVEKMVLTIIREKHPQAYMVEGKFKEFDIFVPETGIKVEVKSDQKSRHSGQFVIEVEMGGKPSGLSTTKADYWVFYDGEYLIWIKPFTLAITVLINGLRQATFTGGIDKKSKKAYFLSRELLMKNASYNVKL